MSYAKKLAQAARREARNQVHGMAEQLKGKLGIFNDVLKPRPKYIPRKLWRWGCEIFIDVDRLQKELTFRK